MTKRLTCHYSVVRFCPYPETDEFVNVAVVLACPALGFLDGLRADLRKHGRVGNFFPELDPNIYKTAVLNWEALISTHRCTPADGQFLADFDQKAFRERFLHMVRPRESILYYSESRVILSEDPAATLKELFGVYVERRFAHAVEYQEKVMCNRLEKVLDDAHLLQRFLRNEQVGDGIYHVRFPFVKRLGPDAPPRQAIKALHLDRDETGDIYKHADTWKNHIRRLRINGTVPEELLFVLQGPGVDRTANHRRAFDDVRRDLDADKIPHVAADATPAILAFATKGEQPDANEAEF
jgi:hypothetical protein